MPLPPGDIWKFLETFLAVTLGEGEGMLLAARMQKPETVIDMLLCLGQSLPTHHRNIPDQNVSEV